MKIIELLNKIANGEEVPKKIKYNNRLYEYYSELTNYGYYTTGSILYPLFDDGNIETYLNDEIEIIQEPKKIEKLENNVIINQESNSLSITSEPSIKDIQNKINEIIDKINEMSDK